MIRKESDAFIKKVDAHYGRLFQGQKYSFAPRILSKNLGPKEC